MRKRGVLALVASAALATSGCTVSKPAIVEVFWQINHRLDIETKAMREEMTFFVHVTDADGEDDIESIYLINDTSEYYWRLQSDSWEVRNIDEEVWIGTSALRMYRDETFPRGEFRILVVDRAGEQASDTLFVSSKRTMPTETDYPRATITGGEITISSARDRNSLWFYDGAGETVKLVTTTAKSVPLSGILSQAELDRTVSFAVFCYHDDAGIGAISGAYAVP